MAVYGRLQHLPKTWSGPLIMGWISCASKVVGSGPKDPGGNPCLCTSLLTAAAAVADRSSCKQPTDDIVEQLSSVMFWRLLRVVRGRCLRSAESDISLARKCRVPDETSRFACTATLCRRRGDFGSRAAKISKFRLPFRRYRTIVTGKLCGVFHS